MRCVREREELGLRQTNQADNDNPTLVRAAGVRRFAQDQHASPQTRSLTFAPRLSHRPTVYSHRMVRGLAEEDREKCVALNHRL